MSVGDVMAARMSYDLLYEPARREVIRLIKSSKGKLLLEKWFIEYIVKDTFGHHICSIIGHSNHIFFTFFEPDDRLIMCERCYRHIKVECGDLSIFKSKNEFLSEHHFNGKQWKCNDYMKCIRKKIAELI